MGKHTGILTKGDKVYFEDSNKFVDDFNYDAATIVKVTTILAKVDGKEVEVKDLSWNDVKSRDVIVFFIYKGTNKWAYGNQIREVI
jgi:hypothetical protein